jgi:hypothetical protein
VVSATAGARSASVRRGTMVDRRRWIAAALISSTSMAVRTVLAKRKKARPTVRKTSPMLATLR